MLKCDHPQCGFFCDDRYVSKVWEDGEEFVECPKCGGEMSDYDINHLIDQQKENRLFAQKGESE